MMAGMGWYERESKGSSVMIAGMGWYESKGSSVMMAGMGWYEREQRFQCHDSWNVLV